MKLILALGLIVIQVASSSCRSISKSLAKSEASPQSNNIAGLILPFLNNQDGNDMLEVVPYGKNTKNNKWKDLKRVAAITPIHKKEKTPLAIILTASKSSKKKKNKKVSKPVNVDKSEADISFVISASEYSSEEDIVTKKNEKTKLVNLLDKIKEKPDKQSVENRFEKLTDIDSVGIDNKEELKDDGDVVNEDSVSDSINIPKIGSKHDMKYKSLTKSIKESIKQSTEPDTKEEDEINVEDKIETDNEASDSVDSGDSIDDSKANDDIPPKVYVVEAEKTQSKKHNKDTNEEVEIHLPESLEKLDELKTYLLKKKHEQQIEEVKTVSETVSKERAIGSEESTESNTEKVHDGRDKKKIAEKSERNKNTDIQTVETSPDANNDAASDEVIKIDNVEEEVDLNADSEVIGTVNSKESRINKELSEDSGDLEENKLESENSSDFNEDNESESTSNSDLNNLPAADESTDTDAPVSTENNSYESDELINSPEIINELNGLPKEDNYNDYENVNNVIEELNQDIIKEIGQSELNAELEDIDCVKESKSEKDKESRKSYNLSFVFNKKK